MHELFEGRTGEDNFTRHRTYSRYFEILTTSDSDDVATAGSYASLPRLGDSYPSDAFAVCVGVVPTQDSLNPRRWLVEIKYDTQPDRGTGAGGVADALQPVEAGGGSAAPGTLDENPLLRPTKWKITFQQSTEALRTAYARDKVTGLNVGGSVEVVNSAGLMFDPGITVEVSRPVLTITKNYADFSIAAAADLIDSVNTTTWQGLTSRQARCIGIETESTWENGVFFWPVTYSIALKQDTWDMRILDAGTVEGWKIGHDFLGRPIYEYHAILDTTGNPVNDPVPLDGAGRRRPIGLPEVYLLFSAYKQRDFNSLIVV